MNIHTLERIGLAAYLVLVLAVLLIDSWPLKSIARFRRLPAVAFLLSSLGYILVNRIAILRYDLVINPDEALMAANAMRTQYGWLNWNIVDPLTSGPLNSAILAWPYLLDGDITLFSTRLTGLGCVFGVLALLFLLIRRLSDNRTAIIAIFPCVLFVGTAKNDDFVHYSSELLPIFLLSAALYLFARSFERDRFGFLLSSSAILGLVPFAKLQAAPMAVLVGAFILLRAGITSRSRGEAVKRTALVLGAALLAAAIYLVPLALSGGLDDAFKSYILEPQLRLVRWRDTVPSMMLSISIVRDLVVVYGIMIAAAVIAVLGMQLLLPARRNAFSPVLYWIGALALLLLPTSYASISFAGRASYHYLLLALPALVLLGGVSLSMVAKLEFPRPWQRSFCQFIPFMITLAILTPHAVAATNHYARGDGALLQGRLFQASHNFAWLRPTANDSMVCWGWRPECYVDAAVRPATREATNEYQTDRTSLREYFRSRFIQDFNQARPDFVVDVVAPGSFGYVKPDVEGIGNVPAFAAIVARDFELASHVQPSDRCPRLYVRRSRLLELDKHRIHFSSIVASAAQAGHDANALDDGSIWETCKDNWLLPNGTLGSAAIKFKDVSSLGTIAILNTRRGSDGQQLATDRIRLTISLLGTVLKQYELSLEPFPRWTFHRLDQPLEADSLKIEVLSFRGSGGGLNEIKAFRD